MFVKFMLFKFDVTNIIFEVFSKVIFVTKKENQSIFINLIKYGYYFYELTIFINSFFCISYINFIVNNDNWPF